MKKRNFSFIVFGLMAVLLLSASFLTAGKPGIENQEKPFNWFSMLSQEQREQFDCIVDYHLNLYLEAQKNAQTYGLHEAMWEDLKQILTRDQLEAFQNLSKQKLPDLSQRNTGGQTCYTCVYAWNKVNAAYYDLQSAISLFDADNCDDFIVCTCPGCYHPIRCSMNIVLSYTLDALDKLSDDEGDPNVNWCVCADAQTALSDIQGAIYFINNAISQTSSYDCDPSPWLSELNDAKSDFTSALSYAQSCVNDVCD